MTRLSLRAALLGTALLAAPAFAHEGERPDEPRRTELFGPGVQHAGSASAVAEGAPAMVPGLGDYGMAVATISPEAQAWFDQGLGRLWGFNHAEAVRAFRMAQALDAGCAMCLWGEAYALGPNLNDIMHPEAEARALEAARQAAALARTPKEQALAQALLARYAEPGAGDRAALNAAFAEAMMQVAAEFPEDANVQVFAADAMMNTQPWDYWEPGGETPKGHGAAILAALERAMEADPDHPGALHLYIHAVEASASPERAEAAADRLAALDLQAGHLAHMPAHIYNRIGRYADSIAANRAAIAADEAFLAGAGEEASALYQFGYYPHNVHFLLVAAQSAGVAEEAVAAADKLAAITSDELSASYAWVQAIRTAPFVVHGQLSDAGTILALPAPDASMPYVAGFRHFARGLALVREGDVVAARAERQALDRLIAESDFSGLEAQFMPARDLLGIASRIAGARIAEAEGEGEEAVRLLREALAMEEGIPYIEPPFWYAPVERTLGAVLLAQGRAEEAKAAFEDALAQAPRDGWALWGLWQAEAALGGQAEEARAAFEAAWLGGEGVAPSLDRL